MIFYKSQKILQATLQRLKQQSWLVLVLFLLIFSPPILPKINILIPLAVILGAVMTIGYRQEVGNILKKTPKTVWLLMILFGVYVGVMMTIAILSHGQMFTHDHLVTTYRFGLLGCATVVVLYVLVFCQRYHFSKIDLFELIIWAVALQMLIGALTLFVPSAKRFLIDVTYVNTGDKILLSKYHFERRFYGFANNLLDTFGYGVGVAIALIPIVVFAKKRYWQLILIPGFALLIFFNARTGLLIGAIGLLSSMTGIFIYGSKKVRLALLAIMIFVIVALLSAVPVLKAKSPKTYYWLYHDLGSVINFATKKQNVNQSTTATSLFKDDSWRLPRGAGLIFGTGHSVYGVDGYAHSDVGYVNDIWLVGILGSAFMMALIAMAVILFAKTDKRMICISIFLVGAILIFQIKGRAIMANAGFITSMLIVMSGILTPTQIEGSRK